MSTADAPAKRSRAKWLLALAVTVAVAGTLTAKAWEATRRYLRSAKKAEATEMLDLIQKGAASYYALSGVESGTANRTPVPCQYPASTGPTPAVTCCDPSVDRDGDGRCDKGTGQWGQPPWSALRFSLNEPHYFSYEFRSVGTGADARFEALAFGDLDCDGEVTTFRVSGSGYPRAELGICEELDLDLPPADHFRTE